MRTACIPSLYFHLDLGLAKPDQPAWMAHSALAAGRGEPTERFHHPSPSSLIPLGSVVLVETKVEKVEEKKIYLSGCVQSTDAQNLHAEATGEFTCGIQWDLPVGSHPWKKSLLLSSFLRKGK